MLEFLSVTGISSLVYCFRVLTLLANIRQGWKSLLGTSTRVHKISLITVVFYHIESGGAVYLQLPILIVVSN
jgi:hypothetical protein